MSDQENVRSTGKRPVSACVGLWGAFLLSALASACSVLPEKQPAATLYDFGHASVAASMPSAGAIQAPAQRTVVLAGVTARGLPADRQAMLYRYAYTDDQQLRAYQRARWSLPVDQLLALQLKRQLQDQWAVLTTDLGRARSERGQAAPLRLHLDLERFEQVFTQAEASTGELQLRATVFDAQGGGLLAQRGFSASVPAPGADAAGGARALADAARAVSADVDQWLQSVAGAQTR